MEILFNYIFTLKCYSIDIFSLKSMFLRIPRGFLTHARFRTTHVVSDATALGLTCCLRQTTNNKISTTGIAQCSLGGSKTKQNRILFHKEKYFTSLIHYFFLFAKFLLITNQITFK